MGDFGSGSKLAVPLANDRFLRDHYIFIAEYQRDTPESAQVPIGEAKGIT